MNDRIHAYLDGELPAEELTPDELATAIRLRATADTAAEVMRAVEAPDMTGRIMAGLPSTAAPPERGSAWRRAFGWFWEPRPITLAFRPAYALAGMAAAVLALTLIPAEEMAPLGTPQVAEAPVVPSGTRLYIQFRLDAPDANEVRLAGSFTEWQPTLELQETGPGVWSALVPLEPGVYDYTFVVDGERWVIDPYAPTVEDSFGGSNSRLFLPAPQEA